LSYLDHAWEPCPTQLLAQASQAQWCQGLQPSAQLSNHHDRSHLLQSRLPSKTFRVCLSSLHSDGRYSLAHMSVSPRHERCQWGPQALKKTEPPVPGPIENPTCFRRKKKLSVVLNISTMTPFWMELKKENSREAQRTVPKSTSAEYRQCLCR